MATFSPLPDGALRALLPRDLTAGQPTPPQVRAEFLTDFAMKMAVWPYLPVVSGSGSGYQFDVMHTLDVASGVREPWEFVAPKMVRTDKPFLKPYPDTPFREVAEGRAWSQTWLARLVAGIARDDTAQQDALIGELVAYAGSRTTTAGRRLAAATLETAVRYAGLDAAANERAARELAALRADPKAKPTP